MCASGYQICLVLRFPNSDLLTNEEYDANYSLKHVLIDCVDVVDICHTFYSVSNLHDVSTNVAGDTILKF